MTGQSGAHTNRPELVAVHGYDTKYAMHALRLGVQGTELLTTGRITLPIPEPHRAYLRSIRRGECPLPEVLDAISDAECQATSAVGTVGVACVIDGGDGCGALGRVAHGGVAAVG